MVRCSRRVCSISFWNVKLRNVKKEVIFDAKAQSRKEEERFSFAALRLCVENDLFCLTYQKSGYIKLWLTCRTHARMHSDTSCALDERMGTSQPQ